MSDDQWITGASDRALEFLASLAVDDVAPGDRGRAFDALMLELDDPAKFHSMVSSMVWVAHCMRMSAAGDDEPGVWTFEVHTPFGCVPVDQAPPSMRWAARWLVACMNGDLGAAADLWFGTHSTEEDVRESTAALTGLLVPFLTHSVREFVRSGKPLVMGDVR